MIKGPGFLAVVWFGSLPSIPSPVSKISLFIRLPEWVAGRASWRKSVGEGVAKSYDREIAWPSINRQYSLIRSSNPTAVLRSNTAVCHAAASQTLRKGIKRWKCRFYYISQVSLFLSVFSVFKSQLVCYCAFGWQKYRPFSKDFLWQQLRGLKTCVKIHLGIC